MLQDSSSSEEESSVKSLSKRTQNYHHDSPSLLMPSLPSLYLMSHRNHPKIISEIITVKVATVIREALSNQKFDFVITENCPGGPGLLHMYLYYLSHLRQMNIMSP